jgi:DNA-binding HxlR family transcriptional regulator
MRTYNEYCAIAQALDVVGERWSLLIVRELMSQGPRRYTDLRHGLPGIATNLLAERLKELEEAGLVRRVEAPPPVATTLFELTDRGQDLRPVLQALGRWGSPLVQRPIGGNDFRSHWLVWPLGENLKDHAPRGRAKTIEIRTADQPMLIEAAEGKVKVRPGTAANPDAVVEGTPSAVLGLLLHHMDLAEARKRGVKFAGDVELLDRVRP